MFQVAALLLWLCSLAYADIVSESEPNNSFAQANLISCGDTVQCAHLDGVGPDFFRFAMPAGDSVYLRTLLCETQESTIIVLYDSAQQFITMDINNGPQEFSVIGYYSTYPQYCYVQILSRFGNSFNTYNFVVDCLDQIVGLHDVCSTARPVTFFPYYDESTTAGCGSEGGTAAPDVYYGLSLATPGDVFIQICSEFFDARVQILTQCVSGYMDDASEGTCQLGADLYSFGLLPQDYYIMVEGTSLLQAGAFSIEVAPVLQECPPVPWLVLGIVANEPFLEWPEVPEADSYLIEAALSANGPFEALAVTSQSFWQDPVGFALPQRFYHVRALCQ
ncbi:MAG: hypothetical protein IPG71_02855 [bacterium]|nr:hypothetical protein [bacterium]